VTPLQLQIRWVAGGAEGLRGGRGDEWTGKCRSEPCYWRVRCTRFVKPIFRKSGRKLWYRVNVLFTCLRLLYVLVRVNRLGRFCFTNVSPTHLAPLSYAFLLFFWHSFPSEFIFFLFLRLFVLPPFILAPYRHCLFIPSVANEWADCSLMGNPRVWLSVQRPLALIVGSLDFPESFQPNIWISKEKSKAVPITGLGGL
jgi:hypothetical protein